MRLWTSGYRGGCGESSDLQVPEHLGMMSLMLEAFPEGEGSLQHLVPVLLPMAVGKAWGAGLVSLSQAVCHGDHRAVS